MADNTFNNSQADNDGNVAANWSLGWVPKAGDVMVFDGAVTHADCTFGSAAGLFFDACRNDNNYGGKVTGDRTITISGVAAIDHEWEQFNAARYLRANEFQLGSNADLHGIGYTYIRIPQAGEGISVFAAGARIRTPYVLYIFPNAGCLIAAGTYETEFRIDLSYAANRTISLNAGAYSFGGLSLTTSTIGDLTLDLATNNPTVTITGDLTIDIDSTGGVTLDASSNALTLQGDLIDEITGGGTFTADSQALTLTSTNNQDIDGCGGTWGAVIVDKTAGTVTLSGTLTCASLTGTDGDLDLNGETSTASGAVEFQSGFTFADMDGTINCDTFSSDGQSLVGAATWYLNATSSGTATGTTFTNCDASGGAEIDASDGTCVDGGGNINVDFGDSSSSPSSSSSLSSSSSSSSSQSSSSQSGSSSSSQSSSSSSSSSSSLLDRRYFHVAAAQVSLDGSVRTKVVPN